MAIKVKSVVISVLSVLGGIFALAFCLLLTPTVQVRYQVVFTQAEPAVLRVDFRMSSTPKFERKLGLFGLQKFGDPFEPILFLTSPTPVQGLVELVSFHLDGVPVPRGRSSDGITLFNVRPRTGEVGVGFGLAQVDLSGMRDVPIEIELIVCAPDCHPVVLMGRLSVKPKVSLTTNLWLNMMSV